MTQTALNKSDLIERIAAKQINITEVVVEEAVKTMLDQMIGTLATVLKFAVLVVLPCTIVSHALGVILKQVIPLKWLPKQYRTLNPAKPYAMQLMMHLMQNN